MFRGAQPCPAACQVNTLNSWITRYPVDHPDAVALRKPLRKALKQAGLPLDRVAVAVSGGPDSALMAVQLAALAHETGASPHIFHIHHGLQAPADRWRDHVHDLAHMLGLPCHSRTVTVEAARRTGTEAAARRARYQAMRTMASELNIEAVFLAHHRDDQAETVLLRLLRGSGPTGLAAMADETVRDGLRYLRPWLGVERGHIMTHMQLFSMACNWWPVYDPTNYQDRYTRSAVRERLAPELNQRWPGWQSVLARHARLAAQTRDILDEVARADFDRLRPADDGRSFCLKAWRALTPARQAHVIRYWLGVLGYRPPTEARLSDVMRQLRELHALGHDRHMRVKHSNVWICCHRGRVYLDDGLDTPREGGAETR